MKAPEHLKAIALGLLIPQILLGILWLWGWYGTESFFAMPDGLRALVAGYMALYGLFGCFPVTVLGTLLSGMYVWLSKNRKWLALSIVHAAWGLSLCYALFQYFIRIT